MSSVSQTSDSERCHICKYPYSFLKIGTPQDHVLKCKQRKSPKGNCLEGLNCQSRMASHFQLFHHESKPISPLQSSQVFIDLTDSQASSEEFSSTPVPTPKQRSTSKSSLNLSSRKRSPWVRKTPSKLSKQGKSCKVEKPSPNQKNPWTITKEQRKKTRKPLTKLQDSDVIDLTQVNDTGITAQTAPNSSSQSENICTNLCASRFEDNGEQSSSGVKRPLLSQHDNFAANKRFKSDFSSEESHSGIDSSVTRQESVSDFAHKSLFVESKQPPFPESLETLDSEDFTTPPPKGPGFTPTIPIKKFISSENESQVDSEEEDLFAMSPQDFGVNDGDPVPMSPIFKEDSALINPKNVTDLADSLDLSDEDDLPVFSISQRKTAKTAGNPLLPTVDEDLTQINHRNSDTDLTEGLELSDEKDLPVFSKNQCKTARNPILPTVEDDLTQINHKNTDAGLMEGLEFSDNEQSQNENPNDETHESPRNSFLPEDEFDDCSILDFASTGQVPFTGPPDAIFSQQPILKSRGSDSTVQSSDNQNGQPEKRDFNNNQFEHDSANGDIASPKKCNDQVDCSALEGPCNKTDSTLQEQTSAERQNLPSGEILNYGKGKEMAEKSDDDSETYPTLSWPSPQKVRVVQRHPGRKLTFEGAETENVDTAKLKNGDIGSMLFGLKPVVKEKQKTLTSVSKSQKRGNYVRQCPFYKKIEGTDIAVDAFSYGTVPGIGNYFLTHFHYDHYGGLDKNWKHKIYCGKVTGNLVVQMLRFREDLVVRLPMWEEVRVGDGNVTVTLLDANHCPGAVMLLFKLRNNRVVLHTGDFRASPDMEKYSALQGIKIDTLHLDTTYLNPAYTFPPQSAAIDAAASVASKCTEECPKTLFVVGTYTIGKERMFAAIAEAVGSQVYVPTGKLRTIQCLEDSKLSKLVTNTPGGCKVHVVPMRLVTVKSLKLILTKHQAFSRIVGIKPTGWTHGKKTDLNTIMPTGTWPVKILQIPYSEHSSFDELRHFVKHTKPRRVIATVNVGNKATRTMMNSFIDCWKD